MKTCIIAVSVLVFLCFSNTAKAATWYITPDGTGDAPTIHAGINASAAGDTILLSCGTFYEYDLLINKDLSLISELCDSDSTTIDSQHNGQILYCTGSNASLFIEGITFANGATDDYPIDGGAIWATISNLLIRKCRFTGNSAWLGGALCLGGSCNAILEYCLLDNNIAFTSGGAIFCWTYHLSLINCTITHNWGSGISSLDINTVIDLHLYNTIICYSYSGSAIQLTMVEQYPEIICSNIYANVGGDWIFALEEYYGIDGNISENPLYCAPSEYDYSIDLSSPCAAESNPECGLIGALEPVCSGPLILVNDVPNDQGGFVIVAWPAFEQDSTGHENQITHYKIQRYENAWTTLDSLVANQSESYLAIVSTDDIFIIGEEEPISYYRVVGYTEDEYIYFVSATVGGYSIDDISPPMPDLEMYENEITRILNWDISAIPDYYETCIFRDDEPGFIPTVPLDCVSSDQYVDTDMEYYCYVIQYADTHGNLSEFSNEVCSLYPSGTEDIVPHRFALRQNHPNPFNPKTTISYELPRAEHVNLRVYDSRGRLVRNLLGQVQQPGVHSIVWDGMDNQGQSVASGTYIYMLQAGDYCESRRMVLVR